MRKRSTDISGDAECSTPITGIADCCARAASGHVAAPPSAAINSRRRIWIAMRPSHGGHATGGDDITPGLAALRDFKPVYVGSGVITGVPLPPPIVRFLQLRT